MQRHTGFEPMKYRTYLTTAVIAVVMSFLGASCGNKEKQYATAIINRDSASVVTTYGVDMFVSENGIIRYHVIAEEWQIFDMTNPPRYSLEKGVLLEVLDTAMQVESTLVADTAYYLTDRKVWHLRHNVHAENIEKEQFDTQELFINNNEDQMYSDSLIRIRQEKQILVGHGFRSNTGLTDYTIRKTEGVFPVVENQ